MRFVDMLLAVLLFFSPLLENCRPPFHWILLTESTLSHYVLSLSPSIGFSFFILVVVYYRTFPCPKNSGQGRIREEGEQKRADLFPINIRPEGYGHTHESALSSSFFFFYPDFFLVGRGLGYYSLTFRFSFRSISLSLSFSFFILFSPTTGSIRSDHVTFPPQPSRSGSGSRRRSSRNRKLMSRPYFEVVVVVSD